MKIDLTQFLSSISLALDLAGGDAIDAIHLNHGRRVAYICMRLAQRLGVSEKEQLELYYASLLHDVGITEAFYDYHSDEALIREHCLIGAENLSTTDLFSCQVQEIVHCHHENWDGSGPFGKEKESLPLASQIIRIADEIELHFNKTRPNHSQRSSIKQMINKWKNIYFSPEITQATLYLLKEERFWWDLSFLNQDLVLKNVAPKKIIYMTYEQLKRLSLILASIIDHKSSYTGEHTAGIVQKALIIGTQKGFSPQDLTTLEISAYLHDLGKLAIPKEILEKPGKLDTVEFSIIKSHVYYSKLLLKMVDSMEEIAEIAGNHHEKLDGTGYPEGLKEKDLPAFDRLLCVLDIYQALIEDRPYRRSLSHHRAMEILHSMAKNYKIDREFTAEVDKIFGQ